MYGAPRQIDTSERTVGDTTFGDALRVSIGGRTVIVANAHTYIDPALFQAGRLTLTWRCARSSWPRSCPGPSSSRTGSRRSGSWAEPRPATGPSMTSSGSARPTPEFIRQILTPGVQQRIMMRDDWVFWLGEYMFACVRQGQVPRLDEMSSRVTEVLDIVTAIPGTVMPSQVDHSADDLVARISRLDDVNDAMASCRASRRTGASGCPGRHAAGRVRRRPDARGGPGPVRRSARGAADAGAGHVQPRGRAVTATVTAGGPGGTGWSPGCSRRSA